MASLSARITGLVLRRTGVYRRMFAGSSKFEAARAKLMRHGTGPTAKQKLRLDVSQRQFQGRSLWTLAPKKKIPTATVLFWHGGGYVYPPMAGHWRFFSRMAHKYGWRIIAPLYPLAPDCSASETGRFALDLYRDLLERENPPSVMGGDSAGAGLAAATAMAARDAGLALPERLLLVCPWLDVKASHRDQTIIEPRDAILTIRGIQEAGKLYADSLALSDPRVSPIYGEWSGLPPVLCFGGGDDILVTDARRLSKLLPELDYVEKEGLMHDWPLFTFPESKIAQKRMAGFAANAIADAQSPNASRS